MILVIDNYDSFTYNLVQALAGLGADVTVRRNDTLTTGEIERVDPSGIVLSPGPGTPSEAGVSVAVVRRFAPDIPILGVCLGHQAIGVAYGVRVVRAAQPVHGKVTTIAHSGTGLFAGLPTPVRMTRYHSLILDPESIPVELEVTAWSEGPGGGMEIQALRHRQHRLWGVQFHPESVASAHGDRLLGNYLEWTR
jgi:anthranilate synthase/aminodeoxychorismate synthase-like glutamine amidotransferase